MEEEGEEESAAAILQARELQGLLLRLKAQVGTFLGLDWSAEGFMKVYAAIDGLVGTTTMAVHESKEFFLRVVAENQLALGTLEPRDVGGDSAGANSSARRSPTAVRGDFKHVLPGFRAMCIDVQRAWTAAAGGGSGGVAHAGANGRIGFRAFVSDPVVEEDLQAQANVDVEHVTATGGADGSSMAEAATIATASASASAATLHGVQFRWASRFFAGCACAGTVPKFAKVLYLSSRWGQRCLLRNSRAECQMLVDSRNDGLITTTLSVSVCLRLCLCLCNSLSLPL
jgi:hypothetical protein